MKFLGFFDKLTEKSLRQYGHIGKKFYEQFGKNTEISAVTEFGDRPLIKGERKEIIMKNPYGGRKVVAYILQDVFDLPFFPDFVVPDNIRQDVVRAIEQGLGRTMGINGGALSVQRLLEVATSSQRGRRLIQLLRNNEVNEIIKLSQKISPDEARVAWPFAEPDSVVEELLEAIMKGGEKMPDLKTTSNQKRKKRGNNRPLLKEGEKDNRAVLTVLRELHDQKHLKRGPYFVPTNY